ncbi:hypothetical protein FKM82_024778 [Ascaphus truei]
MLQLSCLVLLFCLGVRADVQMVQSSSETAKFGQSITISCKASGYEFTDYGLAWLKHAPGNAIEYMGGTSHRSGNTYNHYSTSFLERFEFSTDNANSMGYLRIKKVTYEDTALYYCAREAQ